MGHYFDRHFRRASRAGLHHVHALAGMHAFRKGRLPDSVFGICDIFRLDDNGSGKLNENRRSN
jgi:hypothetical protein